MRAELISGSAKQTVVIDPLQYPGWDSLLANRHDSQSCFFHGTAWARVLNETYGHRPYYFCRFSHGQLTELFPVMEVSGPLTGRRGVSLPFSDFCPQIKTNEFEQKELFEEALEHGRKNRWRYLECRGNKPDRADAVPSLMFYGHAINLTPEPESLFKSFDDSTKRGIRKAERAGLKIEFRNTLESITTFYSLHCQTRRRHGLPPQPFRFFANIAKYVLEKGQGFVATALKGSQPLAAFVFFHDHKQALYKFGASDEAFQHLRPNNFLMWEAIKHCATQGFRELHLGRTSLSNVGLRRFKSGFGAVEEKMEYFKFDFGQESFVADVDRAESWVNGLFRCLPLPCLRYAGRLLYPNLS